MQARLGIAFSALLMCGGVCQATPTANTTNFTSSTAEIDTTVDTPVTNVVDQYSVELKAKMQGGSLLYDQVFNVPIIDPLVLAGIVNAKSILAGHGAVSYLGPSLLSSNTSLIGSVTNTVPTGSFLSNVIVGTATFVGPQSISVDNFGVCQSYALNVNPNAQSPISYPTLSNCSLTPATLDLTAGQTDFDTFVLSFVTFTQTTTTTNTDLITQVYQLTGIAAPTGVPEPATGLLLLAGLAGIRRFRRGRQ